MNNTERKVEAVNSFKLDWPYVSDVRREILADGYDINPTPRKFKSGRPIYEAVFYAGKGNARKVISKRQAMKLTSNSTQKPYYVCRTYDMSDRSPHADSMSAASEALVNDLLLDAEESMPPPQVTILKRQTTGYQ